MKAAITTHGGIAATLWIVVWGSFVTTIVVPCGVVSQCTVMVREVPPAHAKARSMILSTVGGTSFAIMSGRGVWSCWQDRAPLDERKLVADAFDALNWC